MTNTSDHLGRRGSVAATPSDDDRVEQIVGRLLQVGVLIAAFVVVIGGIVRLLHHGAAPVYLAPFRGEPAALRTLAGIVRGAFGGDARAIVQLGLVLLVATPIARVALTLGAFVLQRDRLYVGITAVVLTLLLWSLL